MPAGEGKFCWGFCFSLALTFQLYRVRLFYSWQGCVCTHQCPDKWEQPQVGAVLKPSGSPVLPLPVAPGEEELCWHLSATDFKT